MWYEVMIVWILLLLVALVVVYRLRETLGAAARPAVGVLTLLLVASAIYRIATFGPHADIPAPLYDTAGAWMVNQILDDVPAAQTILVVHPDLNDDDPFLKPRVDMAMESIRTSAEGRCQLVVHELPRAIERFESPLATFTTTELSEILASAGDVDAIFLIDSILFPLNGFSRDQYPPMYLFEGYYTDYLMGLLRRGVLKGMVLNSYDEESQFWPVEDGFQETPIEGRYVYRTVE